MDDVISLGRALPRISGVEVAGDFTVRIRWYHRPETNVDLKPAIFSHPHFVPLRSDPVLFATVHPNQDGNALEWDSGTELSAEWIERLPRERGH